MIPLADDVPSERIPFITLPLSGLVVLGFWIVIQALSEFLTFSSAAWAAGKQGARRGLPTSADSSRARPCCF